MKLTALTAVRSVFEPVLRPLLHLYWRFSRGMTLGVRALVVDERRRVFLVQHSYVRGWHLPGGGVEPGEDHDRGADPGAARGGQYRATARPGCTAFSFNDRISGATMWPCS